MPLVNRTFDQLINFTRTTAATFVGSNGLIQTTPQSRNLLTFTEEFDNAAWGKTAATVTANTATAPDGTSTADTLTADGTSNVHVVSVGGGSGSATGKTFSIYAKAGTNSFLQVYFTTDGNPWANFDLTTGTVGSVGTTVTATISAVGDGWYRCIVATSSTTAANVLVNIIPSATSARAAPSTLATTVFLWGAQLELGTTATDYTRNFGGLFPPRFDYDPVTLAPRGLLIEEQRTNLLLRSEDFTTSWSTTGATITANATTSPDGATTADALVEDASTGLHLTQQFFTFLNATAYTLSIFVRPSTRTWVQVLLPASAFGASQGGFFDLTGAGALGNVTGTPTSRTITAVGGGWYRITVTATSTAAAGGNVAVVAASANGTTSYTGNSSTAFFLWGAQLEAGAFATSYIPTVASQVTRTADVATIAAPNFASWYNQSEGTFVAEYDTVAPVLRYAVYASDGTSNNLIGIEFSSGGQVRGRITTAGVSQASMGAGAAISANAVVNAGIAYATNSAITASEGTLSLEDTSVTLPTLNQLSIGASLVSTFLNGHIRSIRYYPTRLSNAQLQALTA